MSDTANTAEPYEFQNKNVKKAKTRTILILSIGGVLGLGVIAAGIFGIQHELSEHGSLGPISIQNGDSKLELKPFDRDHNRTAFGGENHAPGSDHDSDHD